MKNKICITAIIIISGICTAQSKKTENGVLYAENGIKSEMELQGKEIVLTKILSIGKTDGKDEEMLYRINDIKVDSEGIIYISERSTKSVKKFNAKGEFIMKFGREGDGPGEFRDPIKVFISRNKDVCVLDQKGVISRFSNNGEFINSFKIKNYAYDFVISSSEKFYVFENVYSGKKISIYDKTGKILDSFGDISKRKNASETGFVNTGLMAIDDKDNIYLSYNQPYKIEKYDKTGKLIMVISRKLSFPIVEPNYKEEKINEGMMVTQNQATKITRCLRVVNQKIYHLITPGSGFLSFGKYIDVFDLNGKYLYQIDLKTSDARAIAIDKNESLFAVIEGFGFTFEKGKKVESNQIPQIIKYKTNIIKKKI